MMFDVFVENFRRLSQSADKHAHIKCRMSRGGQKKA
jgi:hypothetical protein